MPKKTYHHGNLREALVLAAFELTVEHGHEQVKMREAARRAGVSAAAPYRHFRDREELLSAVAAMGFQRLQTEMRAAAQAYESNALEQYRAYGVRYVTFAVEHPNLFRAMNVPTRCQPGASPEMDAVLEETAANSQELLNRARNEGSLSTHDTQPIQMLATHALVYGLARLYIDGHGAVWGLREDNIHDTVEAVTKLIGLGLIPREFPPHSDS